MTLSFICCEHVTLTGENSRSRRVITALLRYLVRERTDFRSEIRLQFRGLRRNLLVNVCFKLRGEHVGHIAQSYQRI
ncbi:MAG: DUF1472 domain-containing protein [Clostridiales bacterium]|nr:DUF1472 domain-containing protein [Clostridiales bacterium]